MSDEQNQNENKKCCKLLVIGVIFSLLFSIASLVLSILSFTGTIPSEGTGKKVVISKQYDRGRSLEKAKATNKPIIVFFYTDWCGFCQRFAPTFNKITKLPEIKKNFAIAFVNCEKPENKDIMTEYNVQGFPTVYVIDANGKKTQLDNSTFFNDDAKKVVSENALKLIQE